jgi:hypothetical protein
MLYFDIGKGFPIIGIGEARLKTGSVIITTSLVLIRIVECPNQENLDSVNKSLFKEIEGRALEGFLSLGGKNQSFKDGSI